MSISSRPCLAAALLLLLLVASWGLAQAPGPQSGAASSSAAETKTVQPGVEVLASGPVHEAYAQPTQLSPQPPTESAPKQPPAPVPEMPPDQKPQGANVQWIPGYWQWDAEANQFTWITGVYRNVPPGRQWVEGYWTQGANGWQFVHGFWASNAQQNITYVPQPPESREQGPSQPAPGDNYFYVPGNWVYQDNGFVWQPGYWAQVQPNYIYNPPNYFWTPGGYAYVDGFWDYPLADRGLLFAPVAFTQPLWTTPGWFFRPWFVVGPTPLLNAFFVHPAFGHYHFGNLYAANFTRLGFQPWHVFGPRFFDPLYSHYRWQNRGNPLWAANLRNLSLDRVAGRAPLPPNTLTQQLAMHKNISSATLHTAGNIPITRNSTQMLTPLSHAGKMAGSNTPMTKMSTTQLAQQTSSAKAVRDFGQQRQRLELANARTLNSSPSTTVRNQNNSAAIQRFVTNTASRPSFYTPPKIINGSSGSGARIANSPSSGGPRIVNSPSGSGPRIINGNSTSTWATNPARSFHTPAANFVPPRMTYSAGSSMAMPHFHAPTFHAAPFHASGGGGRGGHGHR
jgi:hypothetical protein